MTSPRDVGAVLAWLERTGTRKSREGMARYAIPSEPHGWSSGPGVWE
jgi:hypothetical protein